MRANNLDLRRETVTLEHDLQHALTIPILATFAWLIEARKFMTKFPLRQEPNSNMRLTTTPPVKKVNE